MEVQNSFWDIQPYHYKGKDAGRLSFLIDKLLYGWIKP